MNIAHTKYPSLREIKEAHGQKRAYERYLPLSRYLFRPVGFWLTWAAVRAGLTSEAVSWLSGVVGLTGCALLVSGSHQALTVGLGLLFAFNLLDCIDGSLARTMKTQNPYGRFLDSVCGGVIDVGFWAVVGIMAFRHPELLFWPDPFGYGPLFWLAIGGGVCFLYQVLSLIEDRFDELLRPYWENGKGKEGERSLDKSLERPSAGPGEDQVRRWPLRLIVATNLRVRETHYFLLLLAYVVGTADLLLSIFLWYYLAHNLLILAVYVKRGQQIRRACLAARGPSQ